MIHDETLEEWIYRQMNYMYEQEYISEGHISIWGVPCGPTLTMVYPVELKGISQIFGGDI